MLKSPVVEILQKIAIPKNVVDNYPFCEWNRNISQKYNCNKKMTVRAVSAKNLNNT